MPESALNHRPMFSFIGKKAQDALWFGETYGLLPESLTLRDKTGLVHEINLKETPTVLWFGFEHGLRDVS